MSESTATRSITFRLYPTPKQKSILEEWLGLHRELYNAALQERRDAYQKCGISLTYNDQQNELPGVKKARPELILLGSHALQETVRRVDRAFKAFFRRLRNGEKPGFPRFKGKNRFDSFTYPDPAGWKILEQKNHKEKLRITNLGTIKMRGKPRAAVADGEPRTLTIRRRNSKWYTTVAVRYASGVLSRCPANPGTAVGVDPGSYHLVTLSTGEKVDAPRFLDRTIDKLRHAQRDLSRKKMGSRNRDKARKKVARLHEKISNQRKNFLHNLSSVLAGMFAFIAIEDMALRQIVKNCGWRKATFNRHMLDAGITMLVAMLAYKAEEAGGQVVRVKANNTSRTCSKCGNEVPKSLNNRIHRCKHCGLIMDRDVNAALNILSLGLTRAGREPSEVWRERVASPLKHETASMQPLAA